MYFSFTPVDAMPVKLNSHTMVCIIFVASIFLPFCIHFASSHKICVLAFYLSVYFHATQVDIFYRSIDQTSVVYDDESKTLAFPFNSRWIFHKLFIVHTQHNLCVMRIKCVYLLKLLFSIDMNKCNSLLCK